MYNAKIQPTIGTQHNKISQPDLFKSCRRFTPCARENQIDAIIAARPINKPNTDPPADPLAAPKTNVPTPSAHAILETIPPIMPDKKYSILRIRPSNEKGALNIIY